MRVYAVLFCCLAGAALAHSGVKDPDVKARMDLMSSTSAPLKVMTDMVRGTIAFDADAAGLAIRSLARQASEMPAAFELPADDPKSEARRLIWENWEDFVAKSAQMEKAASDARIETAEDLRTALADIGKTCSACHEVYRIEKHDH